MDPIEELAAEAAEILDDLARLRAEAELVRMARAMSASHDSVPADPNTDETVFVGLGAFRVDVGAIVGKTGRDDREVVA